MVAAAIGPTGAPAPSISGPSALSRLESASSHAVGSCTASAEALRGGGSDGGTSPRADAQARARTARLIIYGKSGDRILETVETMARRPSSLALYPDATGVSEIERGSTGTLLLGNAGNAAAALSNSLIGLDVAAVICVASSKNASILRAQCARAPPARRGVLRPFYMTDRLAPDQRVDPVSYTHLTLPTILLV